METWLHGGISRSPVGSFPLYDLSLRNWSKACWASLNFGDILNKTEKIWGHSNPFNDKLID